MNLAPSPPGRPQRLVLSPPIVADNPIGRVQNVLGGTVILLQLDGHRLGKIFLKVQNIADIGSPELIDGLVIVPHHTEVAVFFPQQTHQFKLGCVGILVLVHHNVLKTLLVVVQHLRTVPEQFHCLYNNIVKIQGVVHLQRLLVLPVHPGINGGGIVPRRLLLKPAHCLQLILGRGDHPQKGPLLVHLGIQVQSFHNSFYHSLLIITVIDGKTVVIPDPVNMPAKNADAGGMECGNPHLAGSLPHQTVHPLTHLPGCLVGKGDRQNIPGVHAHLVYEVGNAVGENTGLAAPRTRQKQQRPLCVHYRRLLLPV